MEHDRFICPKCGSHFFGSVLTRGADGSIWKTHEVCYDEFSVGCKERVERLMQLKGPTIDAAKT